jgi:hypothetical protein
MAFERFLGLKGNKGSIDGLLAQTLSATDDSLLDESPEDVQLGGFEHTYQTRSGGTICHEDLLYEALATRRKPSTQAIHCPFPIQWAST